MSAIYHPRGIIRGFLRQPAWHARELLRSKSYRALHRFHSRLRKIPRFLHARVLYDGFEIGLCDGPSFLSAWDEIFVNRIYDIGVVVASPPVLVDVGANIGLAALYWKRRYGEFSYLGFEPDPVVAQCCRTNLENWRIKGQLLEVAVSDVEGCMTFQSDGADGGHLVPTNQQGENVHIVKAVRLAPLLPSRVDLLKIDVEGAEAKVLSDLEPALGAVRNVFVEWHSCSRRAGLGAAISLLERAGFDCHIQVAVGQSSPFQKETIRDGFYQNLNIFAVRS